MQVSAKHSRWGRYLSFEECNSLQSYVGLFLEWLLLWIGTLTLVWYFALARETVVPFLIYPPLALLSGVAIGLVYFHLIPLVRAGMDREIEQMSNCTAVRAVLMLNLVLMLLPILFIKEDHVGIRCFWAEIVVPTVVGMRLPIVVKLYLQSRSAVRQENVDFQKRRQ